MSAAVGRRVTLRTIAERVGVSRSTVSNAFSRPDQLSPVLRESILATARELGYPGPHPLARGLRSGRLGVVGVLVSGSLRHALGDAYATELLLGAADGAAERRTALLLVPVQPPPADDPGALNPDPTAGLAADGFVALALPGHDPTVTRLRDRGVPVVTVDSPQVDGVPHVTVDDVAVGRDVAEHVLGRGHRRLAVLAIRLADDDRVGWVDEERLARATYPLTAARLRGVRAAVVRHGLDPSEVPVYETGPDHVRDVRTALQTLVGGPAAPTAVIALADRLALAVLDWAAEQGLRVPADLSVVGVDDVPEAAPRALTTVRQPSHEKAAAATCLLGRDDAPTLTVLPHTLVDRGSVADLT